MPLRAEVQWVRECLEGALAPAVATGVLFDALDRFGAVPADSEQVLAMVRGPLRELVGDRLGADGDALLEDIEAHLVELTGELEVEIDLDDADEAFTKQMASVPHPVVVLVVSAERSFADRLLAAIGDERVYPHTVSDEAAFRHAMFSMSPLIAVLDSVRPPEATPSTLAAALRGLPDQTLPVVWAADAELGQDLHGRLGHERVLFFDRREGIEPLLDLVLSRFAQTSPSAVR